MCNFPAEECGVLRNVCFICFNGQKGINAVGERLFYPFCFFVHTAV